MAQDRMTTEFPFPVVDMKLMTSERLVAATRATFCIWQGTMAAWSAQADLVRRMIEESAADFHTFGQNPREGDVRRNLTRTEQRTEQAVLAARRVADDLRRTFFEAAGLMLEALTPATVASPIPESAAPKAPAERRVAATAA